MPVIRGLEWTFDQTATTYEKLRPGCPHELYQTLFDYIAIDRSSKAVEVGIGGGQATLPILQTRCTLTAVEYGENLAKLCQESISHCLEPIQTTLPWKIRSGQNSMQK